MTGMGSALVQDLPPFIMANGNTAQVHGFNIEGLRRRFAAVATDLQSGQGVLFRQGDTGTAVRASSAVPSVFQPVRISGRDYVDGGLVAPVPVRYAREMGAELVLAVDISSPPEGNAADGSLQILLQTFAIMGKTINLILHQMAINSILQKYKRETNLMLTRYLSYFDELVHNIYNMSES